MFMQPSRFVFVCLVCVMSFPVAADDWPQWLGPNRDSVWREDGIVDRFPKQGLPIKWRAPVALGYSGPAVAGGRVFVTDYTVGSGKISNRAAGRDALQGTERVLCLAADTGQVLWQHKYERAYKISYPSGPRCTPLVDQDKVYTLGAEGDLICLEAETGRVVWSKDLCKEYNTTAPIWGFAAHPLIDGDLLYCLVGGEGSAAVAFNKQTGKELWRSLSVRDVGYCPPTLIEHAGAKQLLIWHTKSLNSLDPTSGTVHWSVPLVPGYGMSITAPRKLRSHLYASADGSVSAMLKLDDQKPGADVLWRGENKHSVYSSHSTPFMEQGMIYGNDGVTGALMGVRIDDGKRLWETNLPTSGTKRRAKYGTAFLVKHNDRFILFSETGDLILAKLSESGYDEISRFHMLDPTNKAYGRNVVWSHPAFANRCVFARSDQELVCVSLASE
jgi:outer membrane protein assembly factor BamB